MKSIISIILAACSLVLSAQRTVGVTVKEEGHDPGYTFFSPMRSNSAYLVDECGFLVKEWSANNRPGLSGYLTETGVVLRANKVDSPEFFQASTGGNIEIIDWDNNQIWSADFNTFEFIQHHDLKLMPNGNILFLGWERISPEQQLAYGRNPATVSEPYLWGEFVYEIKPTGTSDYEIVWEWHMQDHFVQDLDPSKDNYSEISDAIGKIDINYIGPGAWGVDDWWHCNAIDYNPTFDQILVNSRNNNEMWIIDHSTTSEEAATSSGGNSGKGGELLYRWGNPEAYGRGGSNDLRMYGSHGHYWIPDSLPNAGKIMYFNNGDDRPEGYYSTVELLDPQRDGYNFVMNSSGVYLPEEPILVYQDPSDEFDFLSYYLSNAQQLANGNVFINEGGTGRLFEVNPALQTVWQYISPVRSSGPVQQGDFISGNSIFRAYKLPADYGAFTGRDLSSSDPLEGRENALCLDVSTADLPSDAFVTMSYDMSSGIVYIENIGSTDIEVAILRATGELMEQHSLLSHEQYAEYQIAADVPGVYIISLTDSKGRQLSRKVVKY